MFYKATKHLRELAEPVVAEMLEKGLVEMDMEEPEGFLVIIGVVGDKGYMPVERFEYEGKSFLICHR